MNGIRKQRDKKRPVHERYGYNQLLFYSKKLEYGAHKVKRTMGGGKKDFGIIEGGTFETKEEISHVKPVPCKRTD